MTSVAGGQGAAIPVATAGVELLFFSFRTNVLSE